MLTGEGVYVERPYASTVVACLFAALFALVACAAPTASPEPSWRVSELDAHVAADPAAILAGQADASFAKLTGNTIASSTTADRWFRIQLDADWESIEPPVLTIAEAGFTRVHLHAPPGNQERALWLDKADSHARFSRHTLAFVLPANLRSSQSLYLRIERTLTAKHPVVAITDLATYQAADLRHVRTITVFESVQFVMVLVGFCLWLALRDRVFAYFTTYAGLQLVYEMLIFGELYDFPGGWLFSLLGQKGVWFFALSSAAFSISFILEFCNLRRNVPRLSALLAGTRWLYVGAIPLLLLPGSAVAQRLQDIVNLILLLSSLVAIIAVSLAVRRGNRASLFFLVAWMPQVAFTVFRTLQLLLMLPAPAWIEYGFPFTMAFSSIVITLGLADATLNARRERDVAHRLAERDGLTGALNRRALTLRLTSALADARASSKSLALLFLDIDHFKAINDRHGHLAGDACLVAIADAMATELHAGQTFGRYGGEEFLAILPGASAAEAMTTGERLRRRIETLLVRTEGVQVHLTASIGIANLQDDIDGIEQLIGRADEALYRAKADGRNRVGIHAAGPSAAATLQTEDSR